MGMHLDRVLVLMVVVLVASTGVTCITATVENRQIKSHFDNDSARTHRGDNLGRSLRVTKESDENAGATSKKDLIDAEERILAWFRMKKKLSKWESNGVSIANAKQNLGLPKDLYGPALAREKNFPAYLSYVNRIEKRKMWNDIHKRVPTTDYWLAMEEKLKKQIKTVQDLDGIKNTNEFRIFKRYAHLFDSSIVGHMHSGHYNPTHFGNDFTKATNMMEWRARAEIWGEYKIHPADVKMWMADAKTWLSKANTDEIYRVYEPIYSKAPRQPSLPEAQAADKEVLRKFMLDPLMKDKPLTDFHLADFSS